MSAENSNTAPALLDVKYNLKAVSWMLVLQGVNKRHPKQAKAMVRKEENMVVVKPDGRE